MNADTVQPCLHAAVVDAGYVEELPSGSFRAVVCAGVDPLTHRYKVRPRDQ